MVHSSFLSDALDSAKSIAISSEHNIIDLSAIAMGILQTESPFSGIFDQEEKELLLARLEKNYAGQESIPLEGDLVPFTMNAGMLLQFATQYALETGDGELDVYHVLFALFSYPNEVATIFKKNGWTFEYFLAELNKLIDPPIEIDRLEFDTKPSVTEPYSKLRKKLWADDYRVSVAENLVKEAMRHADMARYDLCRQVCEVALDLDKENTTAKHLVAWCLYHEKQYKDAIDAARDIETDDKNLKLCVAACHVHLDEPAEVLEIYNSLEEKDADLHNAIGACLNDLEKYDEAIAQLDLAIEADPEHAHAMNNKGYALMKIGQLQQGKDLILHSLTLDKGNARAYRNLALAYIEEKNRTEALAAVEKAMFFRYREDFGDDINKVISAANAL